MTDPDVRSARPDDRAAETVVDQGNVAPAGRAARDGPIAVTAHRYVKDLTPSSAR